MDATLKQAGKIIELVARSGRSAEWVQNHLLGSGILSDLLRVDNLGKMDRNAWRRFFGLPPLNPLLLEELGTVIVPATTEPFVVHDKFVVGNVGIVYVDERFKTQFLGKTEKPIAETTLLLAKLVKSSVDSPILTELGDKAETTLAQIYHLMALQSNGGEGVLLTNGWANIFYICGVNGELRAVHVHRRGDGWCVLAVPVADPGGLYGGYRVFSRNS